MNTDQQKLDAIRDGVGQAFADLITYWRDVSTMDRIEAGVQTAFAEWLDTHTEELVEAIARRAA